MLALNESLDAKRLQLILHKVITLVINSLGILNKIFILQFDNNLVTEESLKDAIQVIRNIYK
jgi:hypothetical protein